MMELKIKKMRDTATLPTRGSEEAAGIDMYACIDEEIKLNPGDSYIIPSGIGCDFPQGYYGLIAIRSSLGIKRQIGLMNQIGIIDQDYKNEILIGIKNFGNEAQVIAPNERIAQLILTPYVKVEVKQVDKLSDSERGLGGLGSTGRF